MPLRTLSYQVRIWNHVRKANRAAPLPPILAVDQIPSTNRPDHAVPSG
jgi:hypothetical protein